MRASAQQGIAWPRAGHVVVVGVVAALVAVAVNTAVRGAALAVLKPPVLPFPLSFPADVLFTTMPVLFGAGLFLVLRRTSSRPMYWFTRTALAVVALSWIAPTWLAVAHVINAGTLITLVVMHCVPAFVLLAALNVLSRSAR
jgi:hypothetical protein